MKALFYSFLFLFLLQNLNGQIPFAPIGAKYFTMQECPPYSSPPPFLWEIDRDSTIQGKYCTAIWPGFASQLGESLGGEFVHSDGDKVYVYDYINEVFHLVYDFSLTIGESYRIYMNEEVFGTDSATVEVQFVEDVDLGGTPAVIQYLNVTADNDSTAWWQSFEATIYEGIGGIYGNRLLVPQSILILTSCFTEDLCYWSETTGAIALEGSHVPCIPTSVRDEDVNNHFNVYPNPSIGSAAVQYKIPPDWKEVTVLVFSSTGQLQFSIELYDLSGTVALNELEPGIYFITMLAEGEVIGSEKLVVMH